MTWTIRTDSDFDQAVKKLDRPVAARVLKTLVALEDLDDPTNGAKHCRVRTPDCGDSEWVTTA